MNIGSFIFLLVIFSAMVWLAQAAIESAMRSKADGLALFLQSLGQTYVSNYDLASLENFERVVNADPDFAFVAFLDNEGNPFTHPKGLADAGQLTKVEKDVSDLNGNRVGKVVVGYKHDRINVAFWNTLKLGFFCLVLTQGLLSLAVFLVGRAANEISQKESILRTIIESIPGLVSLIDKNLVYIEANQALLKTLALRTEDVLGKKVTSPGIQNELMKMISEFFNTREQQVARKIKFSLDAREEPRWHYSSLARAPGGEVVCISLDIHEQELERERQKRSEVLKNHFPPLLRKEIEEGHLTIERPQCVQNCVVGFADLIGSTHMGNSLSLESDWKVKEKFLSAAATRAIENQILVLNQMGDGFFYAMNAFGTTEGWERKLLQFIDQVTTDVQMILEDHRGEIGDINSGVRFGVAIGEVMVGWIGTGTQKHFTGMGPNVNLAARLCAQAESNGLVTSSLVFYALRDYLGSRDFEKKTLTLKGFKNEVPAYSLKPNVIALLKPTPSDGESAA